MAINDFFRSLGSVAWSTTKFCARVAASPIYFGLYLASCCRSKPSEPDHQSSIPVEYDDALSLILKKQASESSSTSGSIAANVSIGPSDNNDRDALDYLDQSLFVNLSQHSSSILDTKVASVSTTASTATSKASESSAINSTGTGAATSSHTYVSASSSTTPLSSVSVATNNLRHRTVSTTNTSTLALSTSTSRTLLAPVYDFSTSSSWTTATSSSWTAASSSSSSSFWHAPRPTFPSAIAPSTSTDQKPISILSLWHMPTTSASATPSSSSSSSNSSSSLRIKPLIEPLKIPLPLELQTLFKELDRYSEAIRRNRELHFFISRELRLKIGQFQAAGHDFDYLVMAAEKATSPKATDTDVTTFSSIAESIHASMEENFKPTLERLIGLVETYNKIVSEFSSLKTALRPNNITPQQLNSLLTKVENSVSELVTIAEVGQAAKLAPDTNM